ncbi:hypothetical protein RJ55_02626 [Drechmeria coniospora]|nr:hypothetical protein RJ55_02626 [Drechmeria coniospora]
MAANFPIHPIARFGGASQPVKRPKEFACFSYDENHEFRLDDSSMKWYYTPRMGTDLSKGFGAFQKHDDSKDEHLDSLLKAIMAHEQETGKKIDANLVTWRGMMSKVASVHPIRASDPFSFLSDHGHSMNATLYQDCLFVEENHEHKMAGQRQEGQRGGRRGGHAPEVMQFWGYKFETLSTLPATWDETSRDYIENRENHVVNNKEQYCSVVRTGIGNTVLCLGGEVDASAVWDSKPARTGDPINWVELKTSAEIRNAHDHDVFGRKLMKYWIQSFLLGVPKIIVGFRTRDGILVDVNEMETHRIPEMVMSHPNPQWNADLCVNFAANFLDWLRRNINDEGVWRISRRPHSPVIEVYRAEQTGHGRILTDEFKNWRIKLALGPDEEDA